MANHKSAIKRHRQSLKRRDRNRSSRSAVRSAVKETELALSAGKIEEARLLLRHAEGALARAAVKGIINKHAASRKISRLAARVAAKGGAPAPKSEASKTKAPKTKAAPKASAKKSAKTA